MGGSSIVKNKKRGQVYTLHGTSKDAAVSPIAQDGSAAADRYSHPLNHLTPGHALRVRPISALTFDSRQIAARTMAAHEEGRMSSHVAHNTFYAFAGRWPAR